MITKKELNGNALKKGLKARSVSMRWHNKNNSGGNFGFNIYFSEEFVRGQDKEITGYYNMDRCITSLSFGDLYSCGNKIPNESLESMESLISWILGEIKK